MSARRKIEKKFRRLAGFWSEEATLRDRMAKIAHLLTGNFLTSIIGLIGFALTARALGPADYGVLALCFSFTRAVERLVSFQSWQPLIKYGAAAQQSGDLAGLKSLLKFGLLLDISAAAIGWLIAVALVLAAAPLFGVSEASSNLVLIYCTVLLFQVSGMPMAVLRLYGRFSLIAYGQVASSLFRLVFCAIGVAVGGGLWEFALIWMAAQIFGALALTLFAFLELRKQKVAGLLTAPLKGVTARFPGLWRFALSANLSLTIRSSAFELDTLIVGYLADPASAGLYHIAKRIGRIAQQAGVQVQAVLYPELARAWAAKAVAEFRRAVAQMQAILLAFGVVVFLTFYFGIETLLRWTAGPEFLGAAPLAIVQAVAVMMTLCGTVLRSALLAMGLENRLLNSVLIATVGFHATAFVLIPRIGPMGANIAHIVMASVWLLMMTIAYRQDIGRKFADPPGA